MQPYYNHNPKLMIHFTEEIEKGLRPHLTYN